jgi:hypothetical protein
LGNGPPRIPHRARLAETIRNSPDTLKTLSIYEQRISRRFQQTLKQLLAMQADRRAQEKPKKPRDALWSATGLPVQ